MDLAKIDQGSIIKLKKPHPCGGYTWEVVSLGMDCRLKCLTCGHYVLLSRQELVRRAVSIQPAAAQNK